jgi:hypothetical protein
LRATAPDRYGSVERLTLNRKGTPVLKFQKHPNVPVLIFTNVHFHHYSSLWIKKMRNIEFERHFRPITFSPDLYRDRGPTRLLPGSSMPMPGDKT